MNITDLSPTLISTIIVSTLTATLVVVLSEPIKLLLKRKFNIIISNDEERRKHDVELFRCLESLLPEGILKGTLFSVTINAEFDSNYVIAADRYLSYIEGFESGKFIDNKIEQMHCLFQQALREFEKDLFDDFEHCGSGTYRPNKTSCLDKVAVKKKYNPKAEQVLKEYSKYRSLIKSKYQI